MTSVCQIDNFNIRGKKMSLETSKKILKVFGIFSIIVGIIGAILGALGVLTGSVMGAGAITGNIDELVAKANVTKEQLAGMVGLIGIVSLILHDASIIEIISGVFSVKAAKDSQKIMPAWIFALIGVIMGIVSLGLTFLNKNALNTKLSDIIGYTVGLLINILIVVAANNIKKAAGK